VIVLLKNFSNYFHVHAYCRAERGEVSVLFNWIVYRQARLNVGMVGQVSKRSQIFSWGF